jgi:hypothetical protein
MLEGIMTIHTVGVGEFGDFCRAKVAEESYVLVLATCVVCDDTVVLYAETLEPEWKERIAHAMHPECQDPGDDPCAICPVQGCDGSHCKTDPRLPEDQTGEVMLFRSRLM